METVVTEHIIQFFAFAHLPANLQAVSQPFFDMAMKVMELPRNPERTVALRKLLEAKDAAVRAALASSLGQSTADPPRWLAHRRSESIRRPRSLQQPHRP